MTAKSTSIAKRHLISTSAPEIHGEPHKNFSSPPLPAGAAATNRKSNDEEGTLNLQGCEPSCRLSCVTFVYGDVEVRVRPDRDGGFFGSATSGSAW